MGQVLVWGVEDHLAMQEMWKEWLQDSVATPVSRVMSFRQMEQEEQEEQDIVSLLWGDL